MRSTDGTQVQPGSSTADPARSGGIALLVISAATVLAYSNTFRASFHLDDLPLIVQNPALRDLRTLWPPSGSRWLGYVTFALNYRMGGSAVFGYHLVNVLIHVCNGLLVYALAAVTLRTPALRRAELGPLVGRYLPLAAGLLFAVHPLATQAVTYVIQRFASLAALFYLLSLVLYAEARLSAEADRPAGARVAGFATLSVLAAVAAMKTKEISVTLPFVAAGYELLFLRPGRRLLPLLILAPLAATPLLVIVQPALRDVVADAGISSAVYLLTQTRVVVRYLRLLVLPVGQNFDYDFPLSKSLSEPAVLLSIALLLAVGAFAALLLVRALGTRRGAGLLGFFGIAWVFVTLSVESSFIPIKDVIFEHRMYLPSAGAAIALGTALLWGVERLRLRAALGLQCAAALSITCAPLAAATYRRNAVWQDELTLWSDVVAKSPGKARAHHSLGVAHFARGELNEAVSEYLLALRIRPWYPEALTNLGNAYAALGRLDEAIRQYRRAVLVAPGLPEAHNNLGNTLAAQGLREEALREYREALRLDPNLPEAKANLRRLEPLDPAMKREQP